MVKSVNKSWNYIVASEIKCVFAVIEQDSDITETSPTAGHILRKFLGYSNAYFLRLSLPRAATQDLFHGPLSL